MHMRHILFSGLSGCTIFPLWLINSTIFEEKLQNVKYVFRFSLQFLSEIFPFLRRITRNMIKICIGFYEKFLLFFLDFNETLIFSTGFQQILKYQISWKSLKLEPSCSGQTDGETDRYNETNIALRNFSNSSKYKMTCLNSHLLLY
jgi:hypothetical protein